VPAAYNGGQQVYAQGYGTCMAKTYSKVARTSVCKYYAQTGVEPIDLPVCIPCTTTAWTLLGEDWMAVG